MLRPYQILVFLSITERGYSTCDGAPIFPAIFDTGSNLCLTVHESQIEIIKPWGMKFSPMEKVYSVRGINGHTANAVAYQANAWIHGYKYPAGVPSSFRVPESCQVNKIKLSFAQDGLACVQKDAVLSGGDNSTGIIDALYKFIFKKQNMLGYSSVYTGRIDRDDNGQSHLPHLPLLGLRSLCTTGLNIEISCNHLGGNVSIVQRD